MARLIAMALGCTAALLSFQASGQSPWKPAEFAQDTKPIILASDRRLMLDETGTIEVGFTLDTQKMSSMPAEMTLFSQEKGGKVRFRVSLINGARGLRLTDGRQTKDVDFDLTVGGYFHLSISSFGRFSQILINDNEGSAAEEVEIGFGPMRHMPIYLGALPNDSKSLIGLVHFMRVWNEPLDRRDIAKVERFLGMPESVGPLIDELLFYTEFTPAGAAMFYAQEATLDDIDTVDAIFVGGNFGQPFVTLIPDGSTFAGFALSSDDSGIRSLQVLVYNDEGTLTHLGVHGKNESHPGTNFLIGKKEGLRAIFGSAKEVFSSVKKADGSISGQRIRYLTSIGFRTDSQQTPSFGRQMTATQPEPGDIVFENRFTQPPAVDAVYGFINGGIITGIGLARPLRPQVENVEGLWQPASLEIKPQKADVGNLAGPAFVNDRHGTYADRDTLRVKMLNRGHKLEIFGPFNARYTLLPDGTYGQGDARVVFDSENVMRITDKVLNIDNVRFDKAELYPVLPKTAGAFAPVGGQFNAPNQVPTYQFNFSGYNITEMNPMNLQRGQGRHKAVLREPDPLGFSYKPDQGKNVPHGTILVTDAMDTSLTTSHISRTATEHAETQSHSLGFNIGIPKAFSFGVSSSVTDEIEKAKETSSQTVFVQEVVTQYALVTDTEHLELDPDFRTEILRIARQIRAGKTMTHKDWVQDIISIYGTHFPFAVTSGRVSRNIITYTSSAASELRSHKQSLEINAMAVINNKKAGGNAEFGSGFSDKFEQEIQDQMDSLEAVGLPDEPVPVFFDLRPLDQLLTPVYFDDQTVFGNMQRGLRIAIGNYVAIRSPNYNRPEYIWEPYGFAAEFNSIDFTVKDTTSDHEGIGAFAPSGQDESYTAHFGFDLYVKGGTPLMAVTFDDAVMLKIDGYPITKNQHRVIHGRRQEKYLTATEICDGSVRYQIVPNFMVRRSQSVGWFDAIDGKKVENFRYISPFALSPQHQTFTFAEKIPGSEIPYRLHVDAWRIPNPAGQFKPFPICN